MEQPGSNALRNRSWGEAGERDRVFALLVPAGGVAPGVGCEAYRLVGALTQTAAGLAARLGPDGRIVQLTEIDSTVVGVDQVTYTLAALLEDAPAPAS